MKVTGKTFQQFLNEENTDPALASLFYHITTATKYINREVNQAGMAGILGAAGSVNVQGESVQKLDVFANDLLIQWLKSCPYCGSVGSEENEKVLAAGSNAEAQYAVAIDPLDGSSNIDVTAPIGTIFCVYKRSHPNSAATEADFLRPGKEQTAAGYVIYGSSTILVITTGNGVNGFTLDPATGEFILTHPQLKIPEQGKTYSLNEGYEHYFDKRLLQYLKHCKTEDKPSNRPYSGRYIGSLVADFHRTLIKGGIFMYPATTKSPQGKLRLVYEGHPMAFIADQAGGAASDGNSEILELRASDLHQRTPLFTGSRDMVDEVLSFLK